jgi:general secretion pathway protein K
MKTQVYNQKMSHKHNKGVALLLVIWVLALLSVIVGEFCHAMKTEVNITRNFKEQTQAFYIARAGLLKAVSGLITLETTPPKTTDTKLFSDEDNEDSDTVKWRINIDIEDIPFEPGVFSVNIGNEAGKVNINKAGQNLLKMMLNGFDLDDQDKAVIVDSILDWRDENDFHRLNGAENNYYQSLAEPYECKNDFFDSVEELLLVKGVTEEIFYGGLEDLVTVYIDEFDGEPKRRARKSEFNYNQININYAPEQVLLALPQMTGELVQELVAFRKEKDLTMPDILEIVGAGVYAEMSPYITTATTAKSPFYTIVTEGKVQGSPVTHCLEVLLQIDTRLDKKFKIYKWIDKG